MARKTLNKKGELIVQKSRPLLDLYQSDLTLPEFKILDLYLARIDSRHPEKRKVVLKKGEIEEAAGMSRISKVQLEDMLVRLGQAIKVKIDKTDKKEKGKIIWLLTEAEFERDAGGCWEVTLEVSDKAMELFFNIEDIGYLRYKLRCVSNLKSLYSYLLFLYLEDNRFRTPWKVSVEELKERLGAQKYEDFNKFKTKVLERCRKELNEKTECKFTYKTIKSGKRVEAILFNLQTLKDLDQIKGQVNLFDFPEILPEETESDQIDFLMGACDGTFTRTEMEHVFEVLVQVPENKLPHDPVTGGESIDFRRYHYLSEKYKAMKRYNEQKPIKNKVNYFIKMIKQDVQED